MWHQTARKRRRARGSLVIVLALFASATAACGARWTDEQRTAFLDRQHEGGSTSADQTPGGTTDGTGGGSSDSTGGSSTDTGTSPEAAGPGEEPGATGPRPCAQPSDAPGVSDTQIAIGSISSLSGPVPGLGETSAAAARAYVAYRNANGGVCGRELVLRQADDGTDNSGYRRSLQDLAPKVLGIAGGIALGDVAGGDLVDRFGIPIVNTPSGSSKSRFVFDVNPDYPRPDLLIGKYKYLFEQGVRTVAMAYLSVEATRREAGVQRGLMEAAGLKVVDVNELPITTLSYDAAARRAANSGANYLWTLFDTQGYASMARAVTGTGYKWLFKDFSYQTYGTDFIDLAGDAAEGVSAWLRSLPTEESSRNDAMGRFVEWMNQVAPGLSQDILAIDSWVSLRIFVEALEGLPGPISRQGLVERLTSMGRYDADGMFAPIDVGRELAEGCFVGVVVRDGKWQRLAPAGDGFLC